MEAPETNSNTAPDAEEAQPTLAGRTAELPHRDAPEERQSPEETQATVRRDPVSAEAPRPEAQDAPRLHDVTSTFGDYVRGRRDAIVAFAKGHRAATALLITLAVVAVATLAIAFAQAGRVPSGEHIAADARERLSAPTYSGGTFGHDDVLVARDVDVRRITRSRSASAGDNAQFGASGYASAEVVVSYTGSFVSANQGAALEYALLDGTWVDIGEASSRILQDELTPENLQAAKDIMSKYGQRVLLPVDVAVERDGKRVSVNIGDLPTAEPALDIGDASAEKFRKVLLSSKTCFMSGPAGMIEKEGFEVGTRVIMTAMVDSGGQSVIGGGHTGGAAERFDLADRFSYVSTGGGALETFLLGKPLPVIEALKRSRNEFGKP